MQSNSSHLSEIKCPIFSLERYNSNNSNNSNTTSVEEFITPTNKLTKIRKDRLDELEFYETHLSTILQYEIYKSVKADHNRKK